MSDLSIDQINAFYAELLDARQKVKNSTSPKEIYQHLQKIVLWQNILLTIGLGTIWIPNFLFRVTSITCISLYTITKWTIVGHHTCHGGYDRCNDKTHHRSVFGVGWRRFIDWFDWFLVEAWNLEHNKYHHYFLNEEGDPDLVERIISEPNQSKNMYWRNIMFFITICTWRWAYYSPNTFEKLYSDREYKKRSYSTCVLSTLHHYSLGFIFEFLFRVFLPYFFGFLFLSILYASVLGSYYGWIVLGNIFISEMFTNIYTFCIIGTNHAGDDLYRFYTECGKTKGLSRNAELVYRAALGSVNYPNGSDVCDFLHGWLNYQIEHHMFPNLSPLEYQKLAPLVCTICEKYKVQYIQEHVIKRIVKTYHVALGKTRMKVF